MFSALRGPGMSGRDASLDPTTAQVGDAQRRVVVLTCARAKAWPLVLVPPLLGTATFGQTGVTLEQIKLDMLVTTGSPRRMSSTKIEVFTRARGLRPVQCLSSVLVLIIFSALGIVTLSKYST